MVDAIFALFALVASRISECLLPFFILLFLFFWHILFLVCTLFIHPGSMHSCDTFPLFIAQALRAPFLCLDSLVP